jgi:hypothetical protein
MLMVGVTQTRDLDLKSGWRENSLSSSESGKVIRSSRWVQFGRRVVTLLQEGKIVSRVEEVDGKGVRFESGELFGGE